MRLRAIDLHGYKSFAARTALQFESPMTAIVGPNGSGKSNVMDGLRWAIGAGAGRALRTRRAEDVVFSGGRDRAPSGFAEVRVSLDNSERWLDLDAAEVEITRRVHRDGQSEIRVNGRTARLRDVQDLFRNSGLGAGGFALMSQGLVDEMLRLRPSERRQAIEEVGGVRQHRHQMEESRRRRERAQEHLERARLLRDELTPRLKSLERANRRARQVQRVREQLDEALRDCFAAAAQELEHELLARHEAAATAESARASAESQREAATTALASVERDLAVARRTLESAAETIRAARSESRTLEHQQELDQQQRSWLSREVTELFSRIDAYRSDGLAVNVDAAGRALADANAALSAARRDRDQRERVRAEASTRHRRALAEIEETDQRAVRLSRRWRVGSAQLIQTASDQSVAEHRAQAADAAARSAERTLEHAQQQLGAARDVQRRNRQDRKRLEHRLREIDSQIAALDQRRSDANTLRAHVYRLTNDHARADAVFGELMDATLHGSMDEAIHAVRRAAAADAGRAAAIELGRAEQLIRATLESVRFVDDESDVIESAAQGRTSVTPDGIVVRADGVVLGGSSLPGAARLRRQLAELRSEREDADRELDSLAPEPETMAQLAEAERAVELATTARDAARADASRAARSLDTVRRQRAAALDERRQQRKESTTLRTRLHEAQESETRASESLARLPVTDGADIASLERHRDECAAVLAEARAHAASAERARADRSRLSALRRELDQVETAIRQREPLLEQAASAASDTATHDSAREHVEMLERSRTDATGRLDERQQSRLAAERLAVEADAALRETESARARLASEAAAEGIELSAVRSAWASASATQPGLDLNGAAHSGNSGNGTANGSGIAHDSARTSAAVSVAELDELKAPTVDELREQVSHLRTRLQRLGPVDPGAASEYESEQARWQSMESQIEDLERTEVSLREAERDLERQIDRQFREACRKVDDAFQRYFQLMFRGGRAELVLTEDSARTSDEDESGDVRPEVGVDIRAQPPGKRVSSLGLLSGGERALTAIALLFALLEVRPAPFCVLDEVDAALDEANVERFVNALKERAKETQFVVITHNRRTIEQADSIYGVTMGAAGVSRLLSVRVDQLPQTGS